MGITSNFACKVDSVEVNMDVAGSEEKTTVTADDLKTALARTATLEWAHVNQFFFASTDGRNDEKNLLTGGGDMGEFIQGLIAYSKVTGAASLTQADVTNLFERYLKIMSKSKFYFQTDEKAYYKLAVYTGCPNLKIAEVGERAKKKAILDAFASEDAAEFIGDPYIAFLLKNADTLDIPRNTSLIPSLPSTRPCGRTTKTRKSCATPRLRDVLTPRPSSTSRRPDTASTKAWHPSFRRKC